MIFLNQKNYKKHCILLKGSSDITLSLVKEVCEQTAELLATITNMVIFSIVSGWGLQKKLYLVVIFVASSPVLFFHLFSKYMLKLLATFLASSKAC